MWSTPAKHITDMNSLQKHWCLIVFYNLNITIERLSIFPSKSNLIFVPNGLFPLSALKTVTDKVFPHGAARLSRIKIYGHVMDSFHSNNWEVSEASLPNAGFLNVKGCATGSKTTSAQK